MRSKLTPSTLALLGITLCSSGCLGCLTQSFGNSESGRVQIEPYHPALAAGTAFRFGLYDYEAGEKWRNQPIEPSDSAVEPEHVARISSYGDGFLEVRAVEKGDASVSFSAEVDDETLEDSFPIRVIEPQEFKMSHHCDNFYVAGIPTSVAFSFEAGGVTAQGRGRYPVVSEPAGAAELLPHLSDEFQVAFMLEPQVNPITLVSQLPAEDGPRLELEVVERDAVDGLILLDEAGAPYTPDRADPKSQRRVRAVPTVGRKPVCSGIVPVRARVVSGRCSLGAGGEVEIEARDGEFAINYERRGFCEITITALLEFLSKTIRISVDIDDPPSSGGGGGGGGGFDD